MIPIQKPSRLTIFAACEWAMLLPASVFLLTAALRFMQPSGYEPARTSWMIFKWFATHLSGTGEALLLICAPAIVSMTGCSFLVQAWRNDSALRSDAIRAFGSLRRHLAVALLAAATLLALAILAMAAVHAVAG